MTTAHAAHVLIPPRIADTPPALGGVVHRFGGLTMGTGWQVCAVGSRSAPLERWRASVERVLAAVIDEMSTWEPASALRRFNDSPAGSLHTIPAGFAEVLTAALAIREASGGAFDPCAGALVDAWGFGPFASFQDPAFIPPDPRALRPLSGAAVSGLAFDPVTRTLRQPGGLRLDLSAIAKGHAVDRVSRCLRQAGIDAALIDIGGELSGRGVKPDGQPWWVALESPDGSRTHPHRVALHGLAVATSGDYRRCFIDPATGTRRSHTIDPRTGEPVAHALASVTVLHESCMAADGWATALMALGPEQGMALAREQSLAALLVVRRPDGGFDEHLSPALVPFTQ